MGEKPLRDWHSGLFNCFEDREACCYGFWCCPCLACRVSKHFGQSRTLLMKGVYCCFKTIVCGSCPRLPKALISLRYKVRTEENIKGSRCKDIAVSCFCMWCAWCQLDRERRHLKETTTVVDVQPQSVVSVHPVSSVTISVNNMQPQSVKAQPGATVSENPHNQIDQKPQPKMSRISNVGLKTVKNIVKNADENETGDGMNEGRDGETESEEKDGGMNRETDSQEKDGGMKGETDSEEKDGGMNGEKD